MAMSLSQAKAEDVTFIGSMLFSRGVSGLRFLSSPFISSVNVIFFSNLFSFHIGR